MSRVFQTAKNAQILNIFDPFCIADDLSKTTYQIFRLIRKDVTVIYSMTQNCSGGNSVVSDE
jgi:hypothetical protein